MSFFVYDLVQIIREKCEKIRSLTTMFICLQHSNHYEVEARWPADAIPSKLLSSYFLQIYKQLRKNEAKENRKEQLALEFN